MIGLQLGALISGAVITETIFGIAGFGRLTIDAVNQRDYTLIQGVVLVAAAGYVVVNLLVDVVYSLLNPRIRVVVSARRPPSTRRRASPRARRRRLLRKRFLRRPMAVAGLVVVLGFVVIGDLRAAGSRRTPVGRPTSTRCSPTRRREHLLGTDELGRDVLSRLIWGARASMQAGFFATVLAMVVAVPIGLVAGYYRGWVDTVIARVTDVLLAFPFLILAVGLAAILGAVAAERDDRARDRRGAGA